MKTKIILLALIVLSLEMLTGCSGSVTDKPSVVKGGGQFPECLVGVWKPNKSNWIFKFEPDGTIKKLRHLMWNYVDMDEPVVELKGPVEGTFALYAMGDCTTTYEPKTRTLNVTVILDGYVMQFPHGTLEGREEDYFTGQVSEDCKTWDVKWRHYGWLEGAIPPDSELIEANPASLVFTKLDLTKKPDHPDEPHTH